MILDAPRANQQSTWIQLCLVVFREMPVKEGEWESSMAVVIKKMSSEVASQLLVVCMMDLQAAVLSLPCWFVGRFWPRVPSGSLQLFLADAEQKPCVTLSCLWIPHRDYSLLHHFSHSLLKVFHPVNVSVLTNHGKRLWCSVLSVAV